MFQKPEDLKQYLQKNPFILAPMVDHSDHPFRMLVRKYHTGLCFTPMLNSKLVVNDIKYRQKMFFTSEKDHPLVLQLAGHDPEMVYQAAMCYIDQVDMIDLNLGCPQQIAKKGNYGSFLLENEELVYEIVKKCVQLPKPFCCKIRVYQDLERTKKLVKNLEKLGIWMLTIHGRTKEQNKHKVGNSNWEIIKEIKNMLSIPVISNGSIANYQDVMDCMKQTGCDGVMSAEAILEYPAIFDYNNGQLYDQDDLALEYLEYVEKYEDQLHFVKSHIYKMLYTGFKVFTDLRDKMNDAKTLNCYKNIVLEMKDRRTNWQKHQKLGWQRKNLRRKKKKKRRKKKKKN